MNFEFATSRRVVFGSGSISQLSKAQELDGIRRVLLVRGSKGVDLSKIHEMLKTRHIEWIEFEVIGEPTIHVIQEGVLLARKNAIERLIGVGGGSVIDTAKAIAALAVNRGEMMDYLEVVGAGKPLDTPALGVVAIPTTAGTGSEVTRNAVIGVPTKAVKVSLRHPSMLPCLALVDPDLTLTTPPGVTASTGMDAMAQVLEPFVSVKANPMTDAYCRTGLAVVGQALKAAFRDGNDRVAREKMSLVSLMGGLALANAGLGAVHGFAGPLGGRYPLAHGVLCARLLPAVVRANVRALRERDPGGPGLNKYQEAARLLIGKPEAASEDLVNWLDGTCATLEIPRLKEVGVLEDHFEEIVGQAAAASSMKANPISLTHDELIEVLELAF